MGQCFDVVYDVGDLAGEVILEEIEAPEVGTIVQPRRQRKIWVGVHNGLREHGGHSCIP